MKCRHCGYKWKPKIPQPKECPRCKGRLKKGGGRKHWPRRLNWSKSPKFIAQRFILTESSKASIAKVLVISLLVSASAPLLALFFTTQAETVAASPDTVNLWVDSLDNERLGWRPTGASPYLNAQDQPTNFVVAEDWKAPADKMGDFHFSDLSGEVEINSVALHLYFNCFDGNDIIRVYLWDGDWDNYNDFTGSGWHWDSVDVTSVLDTSTKVNNAEIYLQAIKVGGFNEVEVDAAYLEVNYTIPPPGGPILLDPENGVTTADTTPTFSWTAGAYAENHRIEVDNDTNWGNGAYDNQVVLTNYYTPASGYPVGTYYWRVWAVNASGENMSENTWEFTITTWWDTAWQNRRKIEINPMNPENYQIKIFFDNLDGMKSDLSDLRFLENIVTSETLPHWVENYTADNATVWVRRLENADNSIHAYYSNPSASSVENGDTTFMLFDHFVGTALDTNKWENTGLAVSVSNSVVTLTHPAASAHKGVNSYSTFGVDIAVMTRAYSPDSGAIYVFYPLIGDSDAIVTASIWAGHSANIDADGGIQTYVSGSTSWNSEGTFSTTNYQVVEIRRKTDNVKLYIDNIGYGTIIGDNVPNGSLPVGLHIHTQNKTIYADWIAVRKFIFPEPTTTVGAQEPPPVLPTKPTLYSPADTSVITDETPRFEWTKGKNADYHRLKVATDDAFTSLVEDENIVGENYWEIPSENFLSDGKYYWRVSAWSENGENASDTWSFILYAESVFEASSGVYKIWTYQNNNELYEVEMSADGEYIAMGDYTGGMVRLFGRDDNVPLWSDSFGGNIGSVFLTDNGQYLAAGSETGGVRFYETLENGDKKIIWTYTTAGARKKTVKVSGDGVYVTAGTEGGVVLLFKGIGGDGTPVWTKTTGGLIRETAISEKTVDNRYFIAAVSYDDNVYLFDNNSSTPKWSYTTGYDVFSVDISDNGNYIVAGGHDNNLYLFDNAFTGNTYLWKYELTDDTYRDDRHDFFTVSISDDGEYIAAGTNNGEGWYHLFSKDDNTPIWAFDEHGQEVRDVKISGDGSRAVGGGWGGRVWDWTKDDNIPVWYFGDIKQRPGAVAISGNGSLVAISETNYLHLVQDGSFAYDLMTEGQPNPRRVLTYTPEFSFKLPSRKAENTISYRLNVGENVYNVSSLAWNFTPSETMENENEIYITYAGLDLSPYTTYQWRVRLMDNENNWSPWSVTRTFEIVELFDFPYYRTISFTENIPDNYAVRVTIDNGAIINENLLFYDGRYPNVGLPYWVENKENGIAWVKVHDNSPIRMAYGNDNAKNASNGGDTFVFFDNFDGTSVDFTRWTTHGNPSVSGGEVTISGNATRIWTKETFGTDLALRSRANVESTASDNLYVGFVQYEPQFGEPATPAAYFWGKSNNIYLRTGLAPKSDRTTSNTFCDYLSKYTVYELKRIGTDNVELWANDDNLVQSSSTNIPSALTAIYAQTIGTSGTIKIDWAFLRSCLVVEPTVTIGDEETWGWDEIENWTSNLQNVAPPAVTNLYITDTDNIATDNLIPQTEYRFRVEISDNETLADIENVTLVVYLDNENLADNAVNHYTFRWVRDREEIPANTIGTSSTNIGTVFTYQRKTFHAAGLYWAFYSDGSNMVHKTSSDGSTWGSPTTIRSASNGKLFSVTFDGTFIHYVYGASGTSAMRYRRGVPNSDGTITWSAAEQTIDDNGTLPSIIVSGGYPWISYTKGDTFKRPYIMKSSTDNGTWTTAENFPYELSSTGIGGEGWATAMGILTDNKVYAYYARGLAPTRGYGKLWDDTSWGLEENVYSISGGYRECFSLTAFGDNVYIIYLDKDAMKLKFIKRTYGVGWDNAENFSSVVDDSASASLTIDNSTGDIHAFYQTGDNWIRYRKYTASTEIWDVTPLEFYYENEGSNYYDFFTTFERVQNDMVGIIWTSRTTTPWNIKFGALGVGNWLSSPSGYLITDNCVLFDNTKMTDNIVFAIQLDANAQLAENWDVWVQVYDSYGNQDNRFFLDAFDVVSAAEWNLIETWTGNVEAPVAWELLETWTATVEAPVAWELIETWDGVIGVGAPAEWQLVETWTVTIEAYTEWGLIEQWSGTVEAPSAWQLIETWTGTIDAPVTWQLVETWTGAVEAAVQWNLIETWSGTVQVPSEWDLIESWSGTVEAPSAWSLIEMWSGNIEALVQWELIETWDGTIEAFSGWGLIESWGGTVQAPTAWELIETWTGAVEAPSLWSLIEQWSGTAEAYAEWGLIESWTGTLQAPTAWTLIESWSGAVEAPAEWQLIETWNGTVEAPSEWTLIEMLTGTVEAPSGWQLIESWVGNVEAFSGWSLIESWSGTIEALVGWQEIESWSGTIIATAQWEILEQWDGTVISPVAWGLIDTWTGTAQAPSGWLLLETWSGTAQSPSVWDLIETWSGTIQTIAEWSEIESWDGTIIAVGWRLVETWQGGVRAPAFSLIEMWTGGVRTPAVYAVSITITPDNQSGTLGDTLTYTIIVINTGGAIDNYDLTADDPQGWSEIYLDDTTILNLASGVSESTILNVGLSTLGTHTITVAATSQTDSSINDSASCVAVSNAEPDVVQIGDGDLALVIGLMAIAVALCAPFIAWVFIKKKRAEEEALRTSVGGT